MVSSKSKRQWKYDVFINFRGEDTRKCFVSHLYAALANAGVNTFLDDEELRKGTNLGAGLRQAIEGSQIALVVFSKNYASSGWCLIELDKIIQCRRSFGQVVVPIFYDVEPSDVRNVKGAFGEALETLARKRGKDRESFKELPQWKRALNKAAHLSGWDVKSFSNEATAVNKIVNGVLTKLDETFLSITQFPVGLESRVEEVIGFIQNQSSEVCTVGIWGMGGLGKTTVAKAIFNQIYRNFEHRSFIEDIREVCEKDSRGLIRLQEQLYSNVLKIKAKKIPSIASGTNLIEKKLRGERALIVLDDISKSQQIEALCGKRKWMGLGSVLIVTTRDVRILNLLEVDHIYEMKEMDENESLMLFSWHAFRETSPHEDFSELSRNVVAYCGGLPLALEVLGCHLFKRIEEEWKSVLSKLEKIPNDQIQEKLRISYDGLDDMEKKIFLDICCFFIGKDRAYVTDILNGCELHPGIGITTLMERSLIKVEKHNKLGMHDLLRNMGREIIRQSSPQEPEKRSRLWAHEDVCDVLAEHTGTKAIEGLALKSQTTSRLCFNTQAFENMKKLRLLQLDHIQLVGDYGSFPKQLRLVYWQRFPLEHIPNDFYQRNVVAMDLKYSNVKLVWKEPQLLDKLKILNLSHSKYLTHTPEFSNLPNLVKLILKDCSSLSKVHESIGDLSNLVLINFKNCTSLSNLPRRIYKLKSVKTLILSGCSKIDKLEEEIVQMESLTTLMAKDTAIKEVPHSIVGSKSIGYVSLCGYEGLSRDVFPSLIWSWMSPTMNSLGHIHPFSGMSSYITSLDLQNNNLCALALLLKRFSNLRCVWVQCGSEVELTQELRTILDILYDVNFTKLETATHASQVSDLSLKSLLIGMGSYDKFINYFTKSISQELTINRFADHILPGDNYPYWLTHTGEGHSVYFKVPNVGDCDLKGMTLCIIYSSTLKYVIAEFRTSVLIINYTKCTIHICKQDPTISFNDEDWKVIARNLAPGNKVEIIVDAEPGFMIKKIAVYLLYGESIDVRSHPSPKLKKMRL
ncbi:TMV resistance protein N-like [Abrus precatorius]|uniref:ADP-ribosyl cyclase/cyclic ADP-ribose hydrolase n=1 Tax=Abrus precatorius TaxID=3816 RepID=A0A8B8JW55_ABRPR|nr:TMV resistance protein N-like [Abrus precatorius]